MNNKNTPFSFLQHSRVFVIDLIFGLIFPFYSFLNIQLLVYFNISLSQFKVLFILPYFFDFFIIVSLIFTLTLVFC